MLSQMRSWSGVTEIEMDETTLDRGEKEAAVREELLSREADQVDQGTLAVQARLETLKRRAAAVRLSPEAASFQTELSALIPPPPGRPLAWAKAIEARSSALRVRHTAHDAMEQDTAIRSRSLARLAAAATRLEGLIKQAELSAQVSRSTQPIQLTQPVQAPRPAPKPAAEVRPIPLTQVQKPAPKAAERRAAPRAAIETEVTMESDSNFYGGFTEDVSVGGLFIATHRCLPVGTPVDLRFTLGSRRISSSGVVRWVREIDDKNPEMSPGVGVQFTSLPQEAQDEIARFVNRRDPVFYAD